MAFGEVGRFGRPIVHLDVDIEVVIAVPGRLELVVPQPLEVGWQAPGARAGHKQVTAILKVCDDKARIRLTLLQAL